MLMDVPNNNNKAFDGFYNELRRKYPDAFTLATDLGRRNGSLQKLPRLEKTPSPILGFPPNSPPNAASPQRWSPDSFLSKVNYQKTRNEQKKDVEISQPSGNAVIIKDQAIPILTWTRKDYLEAQNGVSFHLPSLRTQIEQNKVKLKNRLNPPKKTETNQSSILKASDSVQAKTSNDNTTTQTTREYTPTQTSRDYTTTQTTREYTSTQTSKDYTTTQTSKDYTTTRDYTPTQTSKDYITIQTSKDYTTTQTTRDYTTTQTTREYTPTQTSKDYITTQTSKDYTTTQTTREYTPTQTSKDYTITRDYTTTQTTRVYTPTQTSKDYTTTQTTREYTPTQTSKDYTTTQTTRVYTPTQTSKDYTTTQTTRDYATTQITKDYYTTQTPGEYTITKTMRDYPTAQTPGDYATTVTTNDFTATRTTNDYMTPKPTKDYNTTQATRDYSIKKPNRDYKTPHTIRDYITTNDYATTKTSNNYTTTQTTRDYTITKPNKDYTTPQTIRDYTNTNDYSISKSTKDHSTTGNSAPLRPNVSGVKSDPLGTIMKELLPNKPSQLMKDLPKTTNTLPSNGGFVSDSDSGVSLCSPMKVFRPKIRSPQAPPASRDIIKKFSVKPKRSSEPLKADHSLVQENITPIVWIEDNPVTTYTKSAINFNEKTPQGPPRARVHFEDESEEDAEFRYQERRLLERTQTIKQSANISPGPQIKYMERKAKSETPVRSSSPSKEGEKPDQKTITLPHRRHPFPPSVAKQVLIDIPRGGLPSRRMPQIRLSPIMKDNTNKQIPPRNVTSLDGITMNFTNTSHERGEQNQSIRAISQDERGHHSLSSLETIESGTTEASSEFTIMKMKRGESSSSIGSGNQSRSSSQNHDLNLDHTSQSKGAEISFYSKVRRSLRLKKKPSSESSSDSRHSDFIQKYSKDLEPDQSSYTSIPIDGGVHGKSSPHDAAVHRLPNQTAANDSISSRVNVNRTKKDDMGDVETPSAVRIHPVKVPYSPMRMMQSLLKKGRAKDYLVRAPSPPPQEARPSSSSVHSSRYRREPTPEQSSGRVLAVQSDSSHLVELQRPKMGFSGLYLTKKNQHGYSGLYVVQLSGAFTSSFPQGILEVGDEILEINRLQAKDLRLDEIYTLLEESSCVLLRVSRNISSSP